VNVWVIPTNDFVLVPIQTRPIVVAALQLGPDGKIYAIYSGCSTSGFRGRDLMIIENPNRGGSSVQILPSFFNNFKLV